MSVAAAVAGIILIVVVLWEGFESIVLPRRVTRRFRLTRLFYRGTWLPWSGLVTTRAPARLQETLLSFYGPLSILLLLGIWAAGLVLGFALLHWAAGSSVAAADGGPSGFFTDFYFSGTTFFTLGLGDVTPRGTPERILTMLEGGMGFGFLALVISYLPPLNQSFARREVSISLLDCRAGSPPTAMEMLRRHSHDKSLASLRELLHEWERWSAEFLEGHLSYPILAYFRSQHENQSWLGALSAILDTCALVMVGVEGTCARQAELTFAVARHAVVDLSLVFQRRPRPPAQDRLSPEMLEQLRAMLAAEGLRLREGADVEPYLAELRRMYEPYVASLARYFRVTVPPWFAAEIGRDNWQVSAWEPGGTTVPRRGRGDGGHF